MTSLLPLVRLFAEEGRKYLRVSSTAGMEPELLGPKGQVDIAGQRGPEEPWLFSFRLVDTDPLARLRTTYQVTVSATSTEYH